MIQPAGTRDIERLLQLEESLFDNPMSERMLIHELTRGRGWKYLQDDQVVGYVLVRFDSGLTDITRLGVEREHHRKGIGSQLLSTALEDTPDAMLTVKKTNEPAILMYRKYGFQIVAHLASAGAWVMRRTKST